MLKYPTCKQGHALVKSVYYGMYRYLPYYGGQYQCAACFQSKSCISGRWFCTLCLVDVCDECQKQDRIVPAPVSVSAQPIPPPEMVAASGTTATVRVNTAGKKLKRRKCGAIKDWTPPPPGG